MIDKKTAFGAALAFGALMLVPGVAPAVVRAAKPLLRKGATAAAAAWRDIRDAAAEAYEHVEDVAAEVRADMAAADSRAEGVETPAKGQ